MMQRISSFVVILFTALSVPIIYSDDTLLSKRLQLLPQICAANDYDATAVIQKLIETGRTSKARLVANECLLILAQDRITQHSQSLLDCCSSSSDVIIETYKSSKEKLHGNNHLQTIIDNLDRDSSNIALTSSNGTNCIHSEVEGVEIDAQPFALNNIGQYTRGSKLIEQWDACCSWIHSTKSKCTNNNFCCEVVEGTQHHLILPALREPKLQIRPVAARDEVIEIEQDGMLQLYDVSGVLWPAGYLLGLCLLDPMKCGLNEIFNDAVGNASSALELGTGVGFASIAFCKTLILHGYPLPIIAADVSKSALDLAVNNAYRNRVKDMITPIEVDYMNHDSLLMLRNTTNSGFDIILGSSLQSLFNGTQDAAAPLWLTVDTLLSRDNPNALVILSHIRSSEERIQVPDGSISFELVRRISGNVFNMKTRDGNDSDFEIVILRRLQV